MQIKVVIVGYMQCNCYILSKNNDVLIIDPGSDFKLIDKYLTNKNVIGIIITHHHFDHIGSVEDIVNKYHCKVYDKTNLTQGINEVGAFTFNTIYTSGHSKDSITIYFKEDKVMFGGDFIFKQSIGRCDLEGGSISAMKSSLKKISMYDDDIIIYPGHGPSTSLGYEKKYNHYFKELL